jgi:multicomponent Na+:H+ antiporter subunit F
MAIAEYGLLASALLILFRLWRGPTTWDRLLAYNSVSNRVVVLLAAIGVGLRQPVYIDVAVTYAAISFLGVVILARFLERQGGAT